MSDEIESGAAELPLVHYSDWAQQPDVRLACDRWTTPSWNQPDDLPEYVYQEDGGELYTFARTDLVTCLKCRVHIDV